MGKAILACGVVLLVAMTTISTLDARGEIGRFLILITIAGGAYVVALLLIARPGGRSRRELAMCLLLALAWRLLLVTSAPLLSDDVYRYIWDGRVQRLGYNPYTSVPDDPALQHLHTSLTRQIPPTSAALPTIYPPAAELFFRVVTTVHESVTAMTLAILVCDALIVLVLLRWLVVTQRNPWWVLAYAWHPLVAIEGAGGAHVDVVGALFVMVTVYALARRWPATAAAAFAVAVTVKFLPIVVAPLLWGRIRVRDAALAVGVGLAVYVPFMSGTNGLPVGSLGVYAEQWRFNGFVSDWLEPWVGTPGLFALATIAGLVVAALLRRRLPQDSPAAWAWPMATTLLLLPTIYPWYLFWLTPFLIGRSVVPLVAWTLGVFLTYLVWQSELSGAGWVLPAWVAPVEYGLIAAAAAWVLLVRRRPALYPKLT